MDDTSQTEPELFTSLQVVAYAGISYRQLDYWTRTGIITAEREAHGSGSVRLFTLAEAQKARTVRRLVAIGFSLPMARDLARTGEKRIYIGEGVTVSIEPMPGDDEPPADPDKLRKMLTSALHNQQGGQHDGSSALQPGAAQGGHNAGGQDQG